MTDVLTDIPEVTAADFRPLNALDRCERCSAQAWIVATRHNGSHNQEFLFCHHHGNKHVDALRAQGWDVDDRSAPLYDQDRLVGSDH